MRQDYYGALTQERRPQETLNYLVDECRKKDTQIAYLKQLIRELVDYVHDDVPHSYQTQLLLAKVEEISHFAGGSGP